MARAAAGEDSAGCPFLREAQARYCQASALPKMIVRTPGAAENERCSSPDYVSCRAVRHEGEDHPSSSHCPFLCSTLVQYCAAAPITKFVPYAEPTQTRCGTGRHRTCETFLALTGEAAEPLAWSPST